MRHLEKWRRGSLFVFDTPYQHAMQNRPVSRHSPRALSVPLRPLNALMAAVLAGGLVPGAFAESSLATPAMPRTPASSPAEPPSSASETPGSASASETPEDATFSPLFLKGERARAVDLSRFEHGNQVLPGTYRAEVYLNGNWIASEDVTLRAVGENTAARPCFTRDTLDRYGVNLGALPVRAADALAARGACVYLEDTLVDAGAKFDVEEQRLTISVPQFYMRRTARGHVDPKFWDSGVTA